MKTTAIVPVYNEEETVGNVLSILKEVEDLDKIIVVNDGSTDNSLEEIKKVKDNKIKLISLEENQGKSGAIKEGVKNLETDLVFFCDADLLHLKKEHVKKILSPLKDGEKAMSVGLIDYSKIRNNLYKNGYFPLIAGQRALPFSIFKKVLNNPFMKDFGLEVVLNNYCKQNEIPIYKQILKNLNQRSKLQKCKNGLFLLTKEFAQVFIIILMLKIKNIF